METVTEKTVVNKEYPADKFPRLEAEKRSIVAIEKLIVLLNERKSIINGSLELLSDYESNERKITALKTDMELANLHTKLIRKKEDINTYITKFINPYLDELGDSYEALIVRAKSVQKKDEAVRTVLKEENKELFEKNWEYKLNFYIALKNYLYPKNGALSVRPK